jgi:hypothetical protein
MLMMEKPKNLEFASPCTQKMCSLLPWYTEFPVYLSLYRFFPTNVVISPTFGFECDSSKPILAFGLQYLMKQMLRKLHQSQIVKKEEHSSY